MAIDIREGYRERLSRGDVVYFVEGENTVGEGKLTVKKATVNSDEPTRRYPSVLIWDSVDDDPQGLGITTTLSPREVFTETEISRLLTRHEGPISVDGRTVDELLVDQTTSFELVGILGGAAIQRLAEDELRNPGNPEY